MKKRSLVLGVLLALAVTTIGCGKEEADAQDGNTPNNTETVADVAVEGEEEVPEVLPDGMARNELSGELIDESLANQRPIAVMIDNESIALPHYGLTQADLVYEMVNSTENGRVTRLMAMVKDYDNLGQFGNIRSARTTNCILTMEWNAILCHDGGPFYIDEYIALPELDDFNATFSRVPNGKSREYTEYIVEGDLAANFSSSSVSKEYNEYYEGPHFKWSDDAVQFTTETIDVTKVAPPFPHNDSVLEYNKDDQLYYYSEYGEPHLDPANDNAQLCFKNVILQEAAIYEYDENGYMYYQIANSSGRGYYITNGEAIEITWKKGSNTSPTQYFDVNGNEITLNVGKTYIGLVPADTWSELVLE